MINQIEEWFEIKIEHHKEELQKKHELGLVCPVCKIIHNKQFITSIDISKEDLKELIDGVKQEFYNTHVLDCTK